MRGRVGRSIYFNHLFFEVVKAKPEAQTFTELLKLEHPAFETLKTEFRHRINRLYSHPKLGDLLDSGQIDFTLMQILEQLSKTTEYTYYAGTDYARNELIISPLFEALFDCNIIWKSKYFEYFHVEHVMYIHVIRDWLAEQRT